MEIGESKISQKKMREGKARLLFINEESEVPKHA